MASEFLLRKFPGGTHYILLGAEMVSGITSNERLGKNRRVICRINDQVELHCAIRPKSEGGYYIHIGSQVCKQLGIAEGSKITATFSADTTEYQFQMPEELMAVLQSDPEADRIFHALTKGNQRGLISLVTRVKSSDKRIEKALKIAERIKSGITSPGKVFKKGMG